MQTAGTKECRNSETSGIRTRQLCGFFTPGHRVMAGRATDTTARKGKEVHRLVSVTNLPATSRVRVVTAPRVLELDKERAMTHPTTGTTPTIFTFQNGKPHPVRIYTDAAGDPLFHVGDLCELLEHVNTRQALRTHVEADDVQKMDVIDRMGRTQQANFVREPGMWSLLIGSRAPNAKKVKRWITSEVLPAIRKTGSYHAVPPAPTSEQIAAADHKNLQRVVWMICSRFHWNSSWTFAVWFAIRQAIGWPAPNRFEVRHLPLIATELRRILEISTAVRDHCMELEKEAIRRIVRNREAAGPFVERLKAEEAGWLNEQKPWHAKLDGWHQQALDALALRQPPGGSGHSDYAEPRALQ